MQKETETEQDLASRSVNDNNKFNIHRKYVPNDDCGLIRNFICVCIRQKIIQQIENALFCIAVKILYVVLEEMRFHGIQWNWFS